jgi:CBS domain-containing protein
MIMLVKQILHNKGSEIFTAHGDATLVQAARQLTQRGVGALIVRDDMGKLAGILSERDIMRAIAENGSDALAQSVKTYMTVKVKTCTEQNSVEELMDMMTHGRFRHVPVLDEANQLCGLISIGDVVKTRIAETLNEAQSLREYISATG